MFHVSVNLPQYIADMVLDRWAEFDLIALAHDCAAVLLEENSIARRGGWDKDGDPLPDIHPNTVARRIRAGKGMGPPLAPDGGASRLAADATVDVTPTLQGVTVTLHWPTAEPWLQYHNRDVMMGETLRPARRIVGLPAHVQDRIMDMVREAVIGVGADKTADIPEVEF